MNKRLLNTIETNNFAKKFCKKFVKDITRPKYLFGRNIYANKILEQINITGFIDDFYQDDTYLNKKVIRLEDTPKDALVLVLSGGNTQSALKRVDEYNLECLDYFSFYKYSGLILTEISMNEGFQEEFDKNQDKFQWIYSLLTDDTSKVQFSNLVNFRYSYDLKYLENFQNLENKQYFEDFLNLQTGEIFLDIGGFDGFTSEEFIKHCPNYHEIHIFEPELQNLENAKNRLKKYPNVFFYEIGLSNKREVLTFDIGGSSSKISKEGAIEIKVDRLDDVIKSNVSFIKMDIEGAESIAIEGGENTILNNHPKIAISVYHKSNDFGKYQNRF